MLFQKLYQRPDKSFFQEPQELNDLMNTSNLIKILTKQADIDKILKMTQRKFLKGTHFLVEVKEIQAGYLNSPNLEDIYLYLAQNKLPPSKAAIRKVESLAERYILLHHFYLKLPLRRKQQFLQSQKCTPIK